MMNFITKRLNRNLFLLLVGDSFIISIAFYLSILFRFDFQTPSSVVSLITYVNFLGLIILKIFCFRIFALYRGMWRYTSVWDMINIIKANILSSLFLSLYVYTYIGFKDLSRSLFIIDFIICTVLCISRLGVRMFFSHMRKFISTKKPLIDKKNIVLLGAGFTGELILKQILSNSDIDINVVAFFDDDNKKIGWRLHGVPVIGEIDSILSFNVDYDEIYICIPSANYEQMKKIVDICTKTKKQFKTLPSMLEVIKGRISLSQFREVSLLDLLGREEINLDKESINKFIKGKRVMVTGAGGSIGAELVRQCINFEPSVLIMIDISELNLFEIEREIKSDITKILFKPILSDIRDSSMLERIFKIIDLKWFFMQLLTNMFLCKKIFLGRQLKQMFLEHIKFLNYL